MLRRKRVKVRVGVMVMVTVMVMVRVRVGVRVRVRRQNEKHTHLFKRGEIRGSVWGLNVHVNWNLNLEFRMQNLNFVVRYL